MLPPGHVTARRGVPVTSAARTVADIARTTSFLQGVVVADSALYRGKTTRVELAGVIDACGHWPGIEKARRVVGFSTELAESPFESIARVTFDERGLPPPELQVWVGDDSHPIARVDFLWSQHRTIAEADGALKYVDPDRARQQLYRDAELRGSRVRGGALLVARADSEPGSGNSVDHGSVRAGEHGPHGGLNGAHLSGQFDRAGSAESAASGASTWPRSRSAYVSLMMAIQIRAVLATWTHTRPAGRPEKYCA